MQKPNFFFDYFLRTSNKIDSKIRPILQRHARRIDAKGKANEQLFWQYNAQSKVDEYNSINFKLSQGDPIKIRYFENMGVVDYYTTINTIITNNEK